MTGQSSICCLVTHFFLLWRPHCSWFLCSFVSPCFSPQTCCNASVLRLFCRTSCVVLFYITPVHNSLGHGSLAHLFQALFWIGGPGLTFDPASHPFTLLALTQHPAIFPWSLTMCGIARKFRTTLCCISQCPCFNFSLFILFEDFLTAVSIF